MNYISVASDNEEESRDDQENRIPSPWKRFQRFQLRWRERVTPSAPKKSQKEGGEQITNLQWWEKNGEVGENRRETAWLNNTRQVYNKE